MAFEKNSGSVHVPVMVKESTGFLQPERGGYFLDGTMGAGGHSEAILRLIPENGKLISIDLDPYLVQMGVERFMPSHRILIKQMNYCDGDRLLDDEGIPGFSGILLDLGFSSYHVDATDRGFSFREGSRLNMRYDAGEGLTAWDVVNTFSKEDIKSILLRFGEDRDASRIAYSIVREREKKRIDTAEELAKIVGAAKGRRGVKRTIDPATKTFQALRIYVNREMDNLDCFLRKVPDLLIPGGRLVVISYHSLEDRLVKEYLKKYSGECICPQGLPECGCGRVERIKILTKRAVFPSKEEAEANRRARSARLRAGERVDRAC